MEDNNTRQKEFDDLMEQIILIYSEEQIKRICELAISFNVPKEKIEIINLNNTSVHGN